MYATLLQPGLSHALVGGKAANLGRAIDLGLSVPTGVVITRDALRLFLEEQGLLESAERLVSASGISAEDYKALCNAVMEAPIPSAVADTLLPLAQPLLAGPNGLAVRSSAVSEDSAKASFAGVYESFLGIGTETQMWTAVRRCWCASWSPHAAAYSRQMGAEVAADGMSVLMQELVSAVRRRLQCRGAHGLSVRAFAERRDRDANRASRPVAGPRTWCPYRC